MLLFWKYKLVALATPKTGSTALEASLLPHADAAILNPPQHKHCSARKYKTKLAPFFEERGRRPLETFALIRNPESWLSSWYRYRSRPVLKGQKKSTADVSFDEFVEAWMRESPPEFARVGQQSRFLCDAKGVELVDHVFAYERMGDAVRFLEARLSVNLNLDWLNQSPQRDATLTSSETSARLQSHAAADFVLWEKAMTR